MRVLLDSISKSGRKVFLLPDGRPFDRDRLFCRLKKCIRKDQALVQLGVNVHMLRHNFCSSLVMSGCPLAKAREIMGHKDYTTTLRYSHLAPDYLDGALDNFRIIREPEQKPALRIVG